MKLLIALGSVAVLTAACASSATVSGSGAGAVKSANTMPIAAGANAGTDAQGDLDVNRVNPLPGKAGNHQAPPAQPHPAAAAAPMPPFALGKDRCNGGIGNPPAAGNRGTPGAGGGKGPQLPACMPE